MISPQRLIIFILTTALVPLTSLIASAQISYNSIILPDNAVDIPVEEKLVQIAWRNNPANKILFNDIEKQRHLTGMERLSWLDHIKLSMNVNEFVIDPSTEVERLRAQFYPLYNIGLSFSIGDLFVNPKAVKVANIELSNAREEYNLQKLQIRAEVLTLYEDYKLKQEIVNAQAEIAESLLVNFTLTEEQFKNAEIEVSDYNRELINYKQQQTILLKAKSDLNKARYLLEQLLGMSLEEAIN